MNIDGLDWHLLGAASLWMFAGILGHFVTKMAAREGAGKSTNPWLFIKAHPWRILSMLFACELALILFMELGQLNAVNAILTGFACQSVNDNMRKGAEKRVGALNRATP